MNFAQSIVSGNPTALNMAKTLLSNPMLVSLSPPWAISLEVESYEKRGEAEVSQFPIIVPENDTKSYVSDNISPMPLSWQMSGYIPGNPFIERRNIFTPIVQLNADFLWAAFKRGSRLIFKDLDQQLYTTCVMSSFSTPYQADCKNKRPFTMTLNEIVKIKSSSSLLDEVKEAAQIDGAEEKLGTTGSSVLGGSEYSTLGQGAHALGVW